MLTIEVQKREVTGKKVASLRAGGVMPAVVYGKKQETTPIQMNERQFEALWKEAGESTVVSLKGLDGEVNALIYSVDRDPVKGQLRHVDFYAVEKGQRVEVEVPIDFVGTAPAVKELGGTLVKVMYNVTVDAEPTNIPSEVTVDISSLKDFDAQLVAGNVNLPSGVTLVTDAEEVIALAATVSEEEETDSEAPDFSAIQVEKKGKAEEPAAE